MAENKEVKNNETKKEEKKMSFKETVQKKAAEIQEKHPRLIKGLRIGAGLAAIGAAVFIGYKIGSGEDDDSDPELLLEAKDDVTPFETLETVSDSVPADV